MADDAIDIRLSPSDAAVILYACRALEAKLQPMSSMALAKAIKAYERQLPTDLSRLADASIAKLWAKG